MLNAIPLFVLSTDEAALKGLQDLARKVLIIPTEEKAQSQEEAAVGGQFGFGKSGFGRNRANPDAAENSGLSPVAAFLLSRYVCMDIMSNESSVFCRVPDDLRSVAT